MNLLMCCVKFVLSVKDVIYMLIQDGFLYQALSSYPAVCPQPIIIQSKHGFISNLAFDNSTPLQLVWCSL